MQTPPSNPSTPPPSSEAEVIDHQAELLRMIFEELAELKALIRDSSRAPSGYAVMAHRGEALMEAG